MKTLSKLSIKSGVVLNHAEMKSVKAGLMCYRSGSASAFYTDDAGVAISWMDFWATSGQDAKCWG